MPAFLLAAALAAHTLASSVPVPPAPATTLEIAPGVHMPMVMLGTYYIPSDGGIPFNGHFVKCPGDTCSTLGHKNVLAWLTKAGGRGVDTAFDYQSQPGIGRAIRESGVPREDIFIVTKVPGTLGYEKTIKYVQADLEQLGVKQIDLLLLHFCDDFDQTVVRHCTEKGIAESWRALEELHQNGTLRGIGVSNFCIGQLELLMKHARVKPMVNQVERHPGYTQDAMLAYTREHGMKMIGYEPLAARDWCPSGIALANRPEPKAIAKKHGVTEAQVLLRWQVQGGVAVNPRVGGLLHPFGPNIEHMQQNLAVMAPGAFNLTDAEMQQLAQLHTIGADNSDVNKCTPLAWACPENHNRTLLV